MQTHTVYAKKVLFIDRPCIEIAFITAGKLWRFMVHKDAEVEEAKFIPVIQRPDMFDVVMLRNGKTMSYWRVKVLMLQVIYREDHDRA